MLTVAVQMDPIETVNVAGDSTFALMLSAQARGHRLFHYLSTALTYVGGRVTARARPLTVERTPGAHFRWTGETTTLDLGRDTDVVLMRQDPPFDMAYITATHLLERVQGETLVVNDPAEVRNAPEKLFVLGFPELMPPTMVTRSLAQAQAFRAEHGDIVIKPLYGNAGSAVFQIREGDANLAALIELFSDVWREPFMVQKFLPDVSRGRQAHRPGRRRRDGSDQPATQDGRNPLQPCRRRRCGSDGTVAARGGDLRRRSGRS